MLISDSKQFIFIHVPKTAGTSVTNALQPHSLALPRGTWSSVLRLVNLPSDYRRYKFGKHCILREVVAKCPTTVVDQYLTFGFVRNPWDRVVSQYNASSKRLHNRRNRRIASLTFKQYIEYRIERGEPSQFDMLADSQGCVGVDFVGRFENLNADYDYIMNRLNISTELPHANQYAHAHYRSYYDDTTKLMVAAHWAKDIEVFNYAF